MMHATDALVPLHVVGVRLSIALLRGNNLGLGYLAVGSDDETHGVVH